jgi:nucleoside-diphosphate-sugar epimerase
MVAHHLRRVLLTGASGFVGRHVLTRLATLPWSVHALSSRPVNGDLQPFARWHHVNLLEPHTVGRLLQSVRPTHLVHLAWCDAHGRTNSSANAEWLRASTDLLTAFCRCDGGRFVGVGSCLEYDPRFGLCSEIQTPLRPNTLYGHCKRALERASAAADGLSAAWARLFYVYGPWENPDRLVATLSRSLLCNRPVVCVYPGHTRDNVHVADVADALVALLESDVTGAINIGSGEAVRLRDLVLTVARLLDRVELVRFGGPDIVGAGPPLVVADVARQRTLLAWRPRMNIESGLADAVEWWRWYLKRS